jgi:hypothetical protein
MKDVNYNTLRTALNQLPQYAPPPDLWAGIEEALHEEALLDTAIGELPQYTPPEAIWDAIATALPGQPPVSGWMRYRRYIISVTLAALMGGVAWLMREQPAIPPAAPRPAPSEPIAAATPPPVVPPTVAEPTALRKPARKQPANTPTSTPTIVVNHATIVVDNNMLEACAAPDDDAFALIETLCKTQVPVCEEPVFKNLKSELDDLTQAKEELRQALGQYSDDAELVSRMVVIERERTQVLQKIIQLI